jgi:hypothetical protein
MLHNIEYGPAVAGNSAAFQWQLPGAAAFIAAHADNARLPCHDHGGLAAVALTCAGDKVLHEVLAAAGGERPLVLDGFARGPQRRSAFADAVCQFFGPARDDVEIVHAGVLPAALTSRAALAAALTPMSEPPMGAADSIAPTLDRACVVADPMTYDGVPFFGDYHLIVLDEPALRGDAGETSAHVLAALSAVCVGGFVAWSFPAAAPAPIGNAVASALRAAGVVPTIDTYTNGARVILARRPEILEPSLRMQVDAQVALDASAAYAAAVDALLRVAAAQENRAATAVGCPSELDALDDVVDEALLDAEAAAAAYAPFAGDAGGWSRPVYVYEFNMPESAAGNVLADAPHLQGWRRRRAAAAPVKVDVHRLDGAAVRGALEAAQRPYQEGDRGRRAHLHQAQPVGRPAARGASLGRPRRRGQRVGRLQRAILGVWVLCVICLGCMGLLFLELFVCGHVSYPSPHQNILIHTHP